VDQRSDPSLAGAVDVSRDLIASYGVFGKSGDKGMRRLLFSVRYSLLASTLSPSSWDFRPVSDSESSLFRLWALAAQGHTKAIMVAHPNNNTQ